MGQHKGSLDLDLANKCLGELQLIEVEERRQMLGHNKTCLGKTFHGPTSTNWTQQLVSY